MRKRHLEILGLVLVLSGSIGVMGSALQTTLPSTLPMPTINAWVASFHPGEAAYSLKNYANQVQELSIFGVGGYASGKLAVEKEFIQATLATARRQKDKPRILLTVANNRRGKIGDRQLLLRWIASSEGQRKHIDDLMKVAESVDGLDIDYENLYPTDGPRFALFISQLAQALHARGKYLSVTVERNALMYASIDWTDLSTRVDRIRIMAYPYRYAKSTPGSISPPSAVIALAERATALIPPEKLEIALPLYGFDWSPQGKGKLVTTMKQYQKLMRMPGAKVSRDPLTQSARISYALNEFKGKKKHEVAHEVWFEDPQSVAHKVLLLRQMGVIHMGLWQLGVGNISEFFDLVKAPVVPTPLQLAQAAQ